MGLDIGAAVIAEKKEEKREIKELTVLKDDDKTSIYSMIFAETQEETEQ
jgi:hypothetical protein